MLRQFTAICEFERSLRCKEFQITRERLVSFIEANFDTASFTPEERKLFSSAEAMKELILAPLPYLIKSEDSEREDNFRTRLERTPKPLKTKRLDNHDQ